MQLKHVAIMPKEVEKALNQFLQDHIKLQLDCYNYSFLADELGFNGLCHALQVQAQDEVLHQRKIINYLFQREANYSIATIPVNSGSAKVKTAEEIIIWWHEAKGIFLQKTHELKKLAQAKDDYSTAHFLNWFIEDFCEEIDELKVLHDEYVIANGDHYKWDRRLGKTEEPPTLKVIVPFYDPE